jgi:hypothetical protein
MSGPARRQALARTQPPRLSPVRPCRHAGKRVGGCEAPSYASKSDESDYGGGCAGEPWADRGTGAAPAGWTAASGGRRPFLGRPRGRRAGRNDRSTGSLRHRGGLAVPGRDVSVGDLCHERGRMRSDRCPLGAGHRRLDPTSVDPSVRRHRDPGWVHHVLDVLGGRRASAGVKCGPDRSGFARRHAGGRQRRHLVDRGARPRCRAQIESVIAGPAMRG